MNEREFRNLPRAIRERAEKIPRSQIEEDPAVQSLLEEREIHDEEHREAVAAAQVVREAINDVKSERETFEARIDELEKGRPELALQILLGEAEEAEDDKLLEEVEHLRRKIQRGDLALPFLESRLARADAPIRYAANRVCDTDIALELRRRAVSVKLAEKMS